MSNIQTFRNGQIELLRFIASISIAMFHFEWIYVGNPVYLQHFYIWVEFFFVISGFFIAIDTQKSKNEFMSFSYVMKHIRKLYPVYIVAFIFSFFIVNIVDRVPFSQWAILLWKSKWEILLCTMMGYNNDVIVFNGGGAPAYISALLICTLILHYIVNNHKCMFINVIGPILIIGGLGRIINIYGNLSQWIVFDNYLNLNFARKLH